MKFLKYYHRWAWGNTKPEFRLIGEFDSESWDSEADMIREICEELTDKNSYNDKYRGISYDVIDVSELTEKEKTSLIEEYEYKITSYKHSIEYLTKVKEMLQ